MERIACGTDGWMVEEMLTGVLGRLPIWVPQWRAQHAADGDIQVPDEARHSR